MNISEGLTRLAIVVRVVGWVASIVIIVWTFVAGTIVSLVYSGDAGGWVRIFFVLPGATLIALGEAIAWVIRGFVKPLTDRHKTG